MSDPPDPGSPISLPDGDEVLIRPIAVEDDARLVQGDQFSERSVYLRFMGSAPKLTPANLAYLTDVDHHRHEALVATTTDGEDLLGVARFVRLDSIPDTAEAAIIVADEWQRRGLGRMLLGRLAGRAREEGISRLQADLLPENAAALSLLRDLGETEVDRSTAGLTTVTIELTDDQSGGPLLRRVLRAAATGQVRLFGLDWRAKMEEIRAVWHALRRA
jgi:GNAT superfamily N-acetyltransferase